MDMSAEPALALGSLCGGLNPDDLLMPFLLMCDLRKINLSCIGVTSQSRTGCVCHIESFGTQTTHCSASTVSLHLFPEAILLGFVFEELVCLVIEFLVVPHKIEYYLLIRIIQKNVGYLILLPYRLTVVV